MVATTSLNMITVCAIGLVTLILTAPVKTKKDAHLVDYSPWPLTGAIGAITIVSGLVK